MSVPMRKDAPDEDITAELTTRIRSREAPGCIRRPRQSVSCGTSRQPNWFQARFWTPLVGAGKQMTPSPSIPNAELDGCETVD